MGHYLYDENVVIKSHKFSSMTRNFWIINLWKSNHAFLRVSSRCTLRLWRKLMFRWSGEFGNVEKWTSLMRMVVVKFRFIVNEFLQFVSDFFKWSSSEVIKLGTTFERTIMNYSGSLAFCFMKLFDNDNFSDKFYKFFDENRK